MGRGYAFRRGFRGASFFGHLLLLTYTCIGHGQFVYLPPLLWVRFGYPEVWYMDSFCVSVKTNGTE